MPVCVPASHGMIWALVVVMTDISFSSSRLSSKRLSMCCSHAVASRAHARPEADLMRSTAHRYTQPDHASDGLTDSRPRSLLCCSSAMLLAAGVALVIAEAINLSKELRAAHSRMPRQPPPVSPRAPMGPPPVSPPPTWPPSPPDPVASVKRAYETNGLFMHMTTCRGQLCPRNNHDHYDQILKTDLPPPLERDCGQWCSAFTFLDKSCA